MRAFQHVGWRTSVSQRACLSGWALRQLRVAALRHTTEERHTGESIRACSQLAPPPPSTEDEDDMLVRMLVQDAFHPMPKEAVPARRSTAPQTDAPALGSHQETPAPQEIHDKQSTSNFNGEKGAPSLSLSTGQGMESRHTKVAPSTPSRDTKPLSPSFAAPSAGDAEAAVCEEPLQAITDSRSRHAMAEPFAVVRRGPTPKPTTTTAPSTSPSPLWDLDGEGGLEWMCLECQAYNTISRSCDTCGSCGALATASHRSAKPPVRHVALMPSVWVCSNCSHTNDAAALKKDPNGASPQAASSVADQRKKFVCGHCEKPFTGVQEWTCPACNHLSPRAATQCPTCFSPRPVQWTCKSCQHVKNSVFSLCCGRCGAERPSRRSNSVQRCAFCQGWNDVRWELCATCMAPCSAEARGATVAESRSAAPVTDAAVPGGWQSTADPLMRDARGLLHSKTVDVARLLRSPPSATDNDAAAQRKGSESVSGAAAAVALRRQRVPLALLDQAWWCSTCNVPQRRNASFCDICLQSRDSMQRRHREAAAAAAKHQAGETSDKGAAANGTATADGDWRCPYCGQLRGVEVRQCCGHQREVPPGYWLCGQCCSTNLQARVACLGCGQEPLHVRPWTCAHCSYRNDSTAAVCRQCGISPQTSPVAGGDEAKDATNTAASAPPTSVVCPVCAAPNLMERLACYRCRARLHDVEWTCHACGHGNHNRQATRCTACDAIRSFDLSEEVWVCEVCSTGVYSGGELPVRTHCPKCQSLRATAAPHFPSRWRCSCGLYNRARMSACPECGTRRRLPTLNTVISCPHCFRGTTLDVSETCAHCSGSLADCLEAFENTITTGTSAPGLRLTGDDRLAEDIEDDEDGVGLARSEAH